MKCCPKTPVPSVPLNEISPADAPDRKILSWTQLHNYRGDEHTHRLDTRYICKSRVSCSSTSTFQPLVAFAVVAATLLNPVETAIAVAALVLVVFIKACMHARLAGGLGGILG